MFFFILVKRIAQIRFEHNPKVISPPLAGGDEGEGDKEHL